MAEMKPLTEEQIRNVQAYGLCRYCGAPRVGKHTVEQDENGKTIHRSTIGCENDCVEWDWR